MKRKTFNFKLKKFLENNKIYFDTIFKIALSIVSIFLVIEGNNLLKWQVEIESRETAPSFSFGRKEKRNNYVYYLHNNKGFISNVEFEKYDTIVINMKKYKYNVDVHDFSATNEKKNNYWFYEAKYDKDYLKKVVSLLDEWGKKNKDVYDYSTFDSYYNIKYVDYQNRHLEENYMVNVDGTGYYLNDSSNKNSEMGNFRSSWYWDLSKNKPKEFVKFIIRDLERYNDYYNSQS